MVFSPWRTWVAGEVVTAAHMNQEVRDNGVATFPDRVTANVWTPTLEATGANPTVSATAGREYTIGAIQFVWVRYVINAPGSGFWTVALPAPAVGLTASATEGAGQTIGSFTVRDDAPGWARNGGVLLRSTSQVWFLFDDTISEAGTLTHNNLRPWAAGDSFSFHAQYPIA